MTAFILAVTTSLLVAMLGMLLIPQRWLKGRDTYTRQMIDRLRAQSAARQGVTLPAGSGLPSDPSQLWVNRMLLKIPGMHGLVPLLQRAGLWARMPRLVVATVAVFCMALTALLSYGAFAAPLAVLVTGLAVYWFVSSRVKRRRRAFIDQFPEALDSLVRCIKTGYPISMAIGVVADALPPPVGPEFKRVADEIAYGWTLFEAMDRLAERIDEPDVRFLSVVLSVQQESGGSLTEVLSNLARVLRGRKQLRLKIFALSSEGRTTAWILGLLPVVVACLVYYFAPDYMEPFFTTGPGNMMLAGMVMLVALGVFFVRQVVNMEV